MSLGIPTSVRRCPPAKAHDRVRFEYEGRCLTPESIVLRRWRDRSREDAVRHDGTAFDGCRLPPGTWRLLQACSATAAQPGELADAAVLAAAVAEVRAAHPTWRAPHPTKLAALVRFLIGRRSFERVLTMAPAGESPGIPDLFLFRASLARGVHGGRFVEVKRRVRRTGYREPVSAAQRIEHDRLKALGLAVDVIYLVE